MFSVRWILPTAVSLSYCILKLTWILPLDYSAYTLFLQVESFFPQDFIYQVLISILPIIADGVAVLCSGQRKGERLPEVQRFGPADWK